MSADLLEVRPAIPLQALSAPLLQDAGLRVSVLRLDLIHPLISGNKWFKLKYNLRQARAEGQQTLLSFGGAYSNHIHALAAAGAEFGFNTIGVIRGEPHVPLNPTLQFAVDQGMHLHYLSREQYRQKHTPQLQAELRAQFGDVYWIPEGGSNALAVKGCAEIVASLPAATDVLVCACGTGATLAGLAVGMHGRGSVMGVAVLKGAEFLYDDVRRLLQDYGASAVAPWDLVLDGHCGGYARSSEGLLSFMHEFEAEQGVLLEQVYTGKMMFALWQMIAAGHFAPGSHVVAVHTGGMQGRQ